MISAQRLAVILRSHGFELVSEVSVERSGIFTRISTCADHIFERVSFHCSGTRGEAAVAHAGISVVRGGNATKGLIRSELVLDLASVPERGWTILHSQDDATEWEIKFADVAPVLANRIAREDSARLLARTEISRTAVSEICKHLKDLRDFNFEYTRLRHLASSSQLQQARRLAEWPGVLQVKGAEPLYEIATTALVVYASVLRTVSLNVDGDPLEDVNLMWIIQLLVDRIAVDSQWNIPAAPTKSRG